MFNQTEQAPGASALQFITGEWPGSSCTANLVTSMAVLTSPALA